ncbi:TrfB-related DNA-binding protein [Ideonella sp. DXS29W]|uniref:TrfB-related DNA-binding protein n=1 Tax=Ideonella lacteola TaxID=2984193 RepID=A0ABU9BW42_9BURK
MKMTEAQFDCIAELIRSKDPARQGARLVLLHDVPNAEAARSVGVTPQSVHRATKRFVEVHERLRRLYK